MIDYGGSKLDSQAAFGGKTMGIRPQMGETMHAGASLLLDAAVAFRGSGCVDRGGFMGWGLHSAIFQRKKGSFV